jgi:hypothetical protein
LMPWLGFFVFYEKEKDCCLTIKIFINTSRRIENSNWQFKLFIDVIIMRSFLS